MMKKKVIAVHGVEYFASKEEFIEHLKTKDVSFERMRPVLKWRENLPQELDDIADVYVPRMPMSDNAEYDLWKIWFDRIIESVHSPVILIGYSHWSNVSHKIPY